MIDDKPFEPFVVPDTEEDAREVLSFLTEISYVYGELAAETERITPQAFTLCAMIEFHNFHVWVTNNSLIEFPEDYKSEHSQQLEEYVADLVSFFDSDGDTAKAFHSDARSKFRSTFKESDP